jgi:hypothetical protein
MQTGQKNDSSFRCLVVKEVLVSSYQDRSPLHSQEASRKTDAYFSFKSIWPQMVQGTPRDAADMGERPGSPCCKWRLRCYPCTLSTCHLHEKRVPPLGDMERAALTTLQE